jgi:hypothetical protein
MIRPTGLRPGRAPPGPGLVGLEQRGKGEQNTEVRKTSRPLIAEIFTSLDTVPRRVVIGVTVYAGRSICNLVSRAGFNRVAAPRVRLPLGA